MLRALNRAGRIVLSSLLLRCACASSMASLKCADVLLVPMFADNYGHILVDRATNSAACIDPGVSRTYTLKRNSLTGSESPAEPGPVARRLAELKVDLKMLLITHKHNDHVGGNEYFASAFPGLTVYGPKYEPIPHLTHPVGDGDEFTLGSLNVRVIHTPCHTKGHVAYLVTGAADTSPVLFPGDTLFVGGCGRFFEGTATDMLANMDAFASLPLDTTFYCAHEYTEANYKFLASVDPEVCGEKYKEVQQTRSRGLATVPSTIGEELKHNLFMRCRDRRTQQLVGALDLPVETMGKLRKLKNDFK